MAALWLAISWPISIPSSSSRGFMPIIAASRLPKSERRRHPEAQRFRGSMAGLHVPLPTLRRRPRRRLRTAQGRCGSLPLHRGGLSPPTPCRSPGALTRVAACTLARSPYVVTAIRRPILGRDAEGALAAVRTPGAGRDQALILE